MVHIWVNDKWPFEYDLCILKLDVLKSKIIIV